MSVSSYNNAEAYDLELINSNILEDVLDPSNVKEYLVLNGKVIENIPLTVIDEAFYFLNDDLEEIKYSDKYKYKPEYISQEQYGTPELYYLIMYVNNITTKLDFNGDNLEVIKYPSKDSIIRLQLFIEESNLNNRLFKPIDMLYKI